MTDASDGNPHQGAVHGARPADPRQARHVGHAAEGQGPRFHGAQIPAQAYSDDDGTAPQALAEAVRDRDVPALVAALQGARLLVALVAQLDSASPQGVEKDSHMAAAMWQRPDGRVALMAFTSVAALAQWDTHARPLPVPAAQAAQAALADGADALLVDRAVALAGPALWAVAESRQLLAPASDPQVRQVVEDAAAQTLAVAGLPANVTLAPLGDQGLSILLHPAAAAAREVISDLAARLAADPVLRSRVSGMQIGVAPATPQGR